MNLLTMRPGEHKIIDVTAPYRALFFPALELIVLTGLFWMGIGWLDTHLNNPSLRNAVVVAWAVLALLRFLRPLVRARRRRFIVTNTRVIARNGTKIDSIPLTDIADVRRRRGGISLAIRGYAQPLYFPELPKTRSIEHAIGSRLQLVRRGLG